jgi:hypothetical protein
MFINKLAGYKSHQEDEIYESKEDLIFERNASGFFLHSVFRLYLMKCYCMKGLLYERYYISKFSLFDDRPIVNESKFHLLSEKELKRSGPQKLNRAQC